MTAVLLIISIFAQVLQQVCRKEYNKKVSGNPLSFSAAGVFAGLLYFLVLSGGQLALQGEMFWYILPFALCYTIAYVCTIYAIQYGPLSLTSLLISCSVVIPLLYGVVFLNEPVTLFLIAGIVFLFSGITLVSEPWNKEAVQISPKWVVYISATFLSNGICMILQKNFQLKYQGAHSNTFMVYSLAITFLTLCVFVLVRERKRFFKTIGSKNIIWPIFCGTGNGVANQLTMMVATALPASFLYPVQAAGGIILTAAVSILLYKEKLSFAQKIGFVMGIVAVIAFNL